MFEELGNAWKPSGQLFNLIDPADFSAGKAVITKSKLSGNSQKCLLNSLNLIKFIF